MESTCFGTSGALVPKLKRVEAKVGGVAEGAVPVLPKVGFTDSVTLALAVVAENVDVFEKEIPPVDDLFSVAFEMPKLIDDDVLVNVPAAATRLENFVFGSSAAWTPGRLDEQHAHTFLSESFLTRHVVHDHLSSDDPWE